MRLNFKIPSIGQLEKAYARLSFEKISARRLALYSQWVRFDPRLGELFVQSISKNWESLNPMALRAYILLQPWPFSLGLMLEYVNPQTQKELFSAWKACIVFDLPKAQGEIFYFDHYAMAGKRMQEDLQLSHSAFIRWGCYGRDFFNQIPQVTYSVEQRMNLLKHLLKTQTKITINDYLRCIGHSLSRRQAERDIHAAPFVKKIGTTRNCFYVHNTRH